MRRQDVSWCGVFAGAGISVPLVQSAHPLDPLSPTEIAVAISTVRTAGSTPEVYSSSPPFVPLSLSLQEHHHHPSSCARIRFVCSPLSCSLFPSDHIEDSGAVCRCNSTGCKLPVQPTHVLILSK